jgi:hypothetical protein
MAQKLFNCINLYKNSQIIEEKPADNELFDAKNESANNQNREGQTRE